MRRVPMLLLLLSVFNLGFSFRSVAQDSHTQKLLDGAKKEGALVWYMSASIEDAQAILLAFNKKYPFLKTDFFRAGSARLFNRIMNEARAGKVLFDLVAGARPGNAPIGESGTLAALRFSRERGLSRRFQGLEGILGRLFRFLQRHRLQHPTGGARAGAEELGGSARSEMEGQDRPRRGKLLLVWSDDPKMGKGENPTIHAGIDQTGIQLRNGQTLLAIAQLMAAGEFSVAMVLAHRIEKMKEQGAPVAWVTTLDPVTVSLHPIGIAAKAPHPNAAKLFVDFILSKDGQQLLLSIERTPARPGIDTKMEARKLSFSPCHPSSASATNNFKKSFEKSSADRASCLG